MVVMVHTPPPNIREPYMRARERYWAEATRVERTDARRRRNVECATGS